MSLIVQYLKYERTHTCRRSGRKCIRMTEIRPLYFEDEHIYPQTRASDCRIK